MNSSLWKQKKVFITGHTGFIGRHLVDTLKSYGARVQGSEVDLLKERLVSHGYQPPDYVFHLAAKSPAATDVVDTARIIRDNVSMTMNVLEFARAASAKVVVASSSHVYAPVAGKDGHPLDESEVVPGQAMSAFGISKQETEKACREFGEKHGVPVMLVRLSNVYGPGDRSNRFIPTFVRKCLQRQFPLEVLGSGETIRDFVYIDDAVDGLLSASLISESMDVVNIGGGRAVSIAEVTNAIKHAADLDNQPVRYLNPEESNISYNVLNSNKALQKIGYVPKVSLAEGMQKTVLWWQIQEKNK